MKALLSRERRCSQRGFALAEIVVAVTVLAILIGASVPLANRVVMYKARQATSAELSELREGAGAFFQDLEALPTRIDELLADPGTPGWIGPYLPLGRTEQPVDPSGYVLDAWSRPYTLIVSGDGLTIRSLGADGVRSDDDVTIDLDVRHIRRIKTQIRLERINRAIERYNAQYQDSPLPEDYQSLYARLVSTGFLPGTPDSPVVAVTSDAH